MKNKDTHTVPHNYVIGIFLVGSHLHNYFCIYQAAKSNRRHHVTAAAAAAAFFCTLRLSAVSFIMKS